MLGQGGLMPRSGLSGPLLRHLQLGLGRGVTDAQKGTEGLEKLEFRLSDVETRV